ncbi:hypothetical protein C8R43DRAFT_1141084 [Mycena crocata]|nr:hypothetical protein C8R43DRAFT_1141084 [Mycena crocata]
MPAPPAYTSVPAPDIDDLAAHVSRLNLTSTSQPITPVTPPRSSRANDTLYRYESPTQSGYTRAWAKAACATQSVPGGHVKAAVKGKRKHVKRAAFVVFIGTDPGAYEKWSEVQPLVKGISGNLYQGYSSMKAAVAAFDYAQQRSWTRKCPSRHASSSSATLTVAPAIPTLPQPASLLELETPNPLHCDDEDALWYVVYQGITPGVYQSNLECALNTVGLKGAVHDSWVEKEVAIAKYQQALLAGTVEVLLPPYY